MRKLLCVIAFACLVFPVAATAYDHPANPILHYGNKGQRVKDLQWLLSGGKPSAYRISTLPRKYVGGTYGRRTVNAVREMKYRLGFGKVDGRAGPDFIQILLGKRKRPLSYIKRATDRLAAQKKIVAETASSRCAKALIAKERSQLGVHERPWGSNRGPRISYPVNGVLSYQGATGAYGEAWCASFQAWAYRLTHVGFPSAWDSYIGSNRYDSAGVFAIVRNASRRGWIRAIPKPGYLVAFVDRLGHIGLVEKVTKTGFYSIEGNASDQVLRRFHPFGSRPTVFIAIPGCDG